MIATHSLIALRLPKRITSSLAELAEEEGKDRSALLRELIALGIAEKSVEKAVRFYSTGRVSAWKAASIAGVSLWEMIEILRRRGVEAQYGLKELEEDLEALQ